MESTFLADDAACLTLVRVVIQLRCFGIVSLGCGLLSCVVCGVSSMEYGFRQSSIPSVSSHSPSCLFRRNRGDWRSTEPSELGPDYRVVAHAATLALLQSLSSQGFSFFVSTLEALNFQPEELANPSAEGWWPRRGDVFPGLRGCRRPVSWHWRGACERARGA